MAKQFPQRYGELEEAILRHLYDNPTPRPAHTTYNLAGALRKESLAELGAGSPEWRAKIQQDREEVQRTIESLILKHLIKGDRERDDKMIHFTNLKLTSKGEAEAIRLNREHEAAELSLREADRVSRELMETVYADSGKATRQPRPEFLVKPSFIPPGLGGECTINLEQGSVKWWKLYRSDRAALTEAIEMGLILEPDQRPQGGDLAVHPIQRSFVSEVEIDPAELTRREFNKHAGH